MEKTVFLGLGTMGFHMAGHLSNKLSQKIYVYNRSFSKVNHWQKNYPKGIASDQLIETVTGAKYILMCLGRDEDVLSIIENPEFLNAVHPQAIIVDHTTTSYSLVQKINQILKSLEIKFVDAPVSGGESGAIKGILSAMIGGNETDVKTVKPLLEHYCQSITHIGKTGSGQLAKMANQICISGVLQGLSEAILFAENEQLDIKKLIQAISGGAAQSWQLNNRALTMHNREFDFGFAINWMIKDLGYCIDQAQKNKTQLSLTKDVYERYRELSEKGEQSSDTSVLIKANE